MVAKNAEPAAGATPTRSSPPKIAITPTRFSLSPGAGQEFQLDGCKLEVQCEAPAPRLLLKRGKKHEMQWPLSELASIDVCTAATEACEPHVRFFLSSNIEHMQKGEPADEKLREAMRGALQRGPKIFFMTSADATQLLAALREKKDAGADCLAKIALGRDSPPPSGDSAAAAFDRLSLTSPAPASRCASMASISSSSSGRLSAERDTLIFVCSPAQCVLPQAKDEAIDVANAVRACVAVT